MCCVAKCMAAHIRFLRLMDGRCFVTFHRYCELQCNCMGQISTVFSVQQILRRASLLPRQGAPVGDGFLSPTNTNPSFSESGISRLVTRPSPRRLLALGRKPFDSAVRGSKVETGHGFSPFVETPLCPIASRPMQLEVTLLMLSLILMLAYQCLSEL